MNVGLTLTVEAKLLVVAFHLNLGVNFNFISREIVMDGFHDLVNKLISQPLTAEIGRGNNQAKGYQAGLL